MPNITVPNYPNSNRTPGVFFSVDPSNANSATQNLKTLIIGQMLSTGTATPNVPFLFTSQTDLWAKVGGAGAMLSRQWLKYDGDDSFGEVWILPVADNAGGVAAIQTMTVTAASPGAGVLSLYIAGQLVSVPVVTTDTATTIATNIVAATSTAKMPSLPCAVTSAAGVVTFTAKHKGAAAGDIDLRVNYLGSVAGEVLPTGVTAAFAVTTPGTTDPVLDPAVANVTSRYAFICSPYSVSTQMASLQALLNDVTGTWSWMTDTGGGVFSAVKGANTAALTTYSANNNLQHFSIIGFSDTPSPVYEIAASYCAVCANSLRVDPALPLKNIVLSGVLAPPQQSRYTRTARNTLLYAGIATWTANAANQVVLERAITTYTTNTAGVVDDSYLQVETLYTIQAVIDLWKTSFSTKYSRVKLVSDNTPIRAGTNMVNPTSIRAEVIAQYQAAADQGLVQDVPTFIKTVAVQQVSPYQVNIFAPIHVADQLFEMAFDMQFIK